MQSPSGSRETVGALRWRHEVGLDLLDPPAPGGDEEVHRAVLGGPIVEEGSYFYCRRRDLKRRLDCQSKSNSQIEKGFTRGTKAETLSWTVV